MRLIQRKIEEVVKQFQTTNPFEIAKGKKIIIRFLPLGNTLGFYMKNLRHQVITLNCDMDEYLVNFVCAHELGHAILHPDKNTPFLHKHTLFSRDKIEREANEFATKLILYDANFEDYETKNAILREYGIPYKMERHIEVPTSKFFYL